MAKFIQRFEHAVNRMQLLGSILFWVLIISLVLTIGIGVLSVIAIINLLQEGFVFNNSLYISGQNSSFSIVYVIFYFLLFMLVEGTLLAVTVSMKKGGTPFTRKNSNLFVILGCSFLFAAILKGILEYYQLNGGYIEINLGSFQLYDDLSSFMLRTLSGGISIDLGLLFFSLFCFVIATIWRYAYLLQRQSDGLV